MYTGLSPQITKWIWVNSALSVILLLAAVAVVVVSLYFFEGKTPEEVVSFMRDHGFRKNESLLPYTERTYGVIFALLFMIGLFAVGALVGTVLGTTGGLAHLEGPKGEHWISAIGFSSMVICCLSFVGGVRLGKIGDRIQEILQDRGRGFSVEAKRQIGQSAVKNRLDLSNPNCNPFLEDPGGTPKMRMPLCRILTEPRRPGLVK
jgi:hypothetical protein